MKHAFFLYHRSLVDGGHVECTNLTQERAGSTEGEVTRYGRSPSCNDLSNVEWNHKTARHTNFKLHSVCTVSRSPSSFSPSLTHYIDFMKLSNDFVRFNHSFNEISIKKTKYWSELWFLALT